MINIKIDSRKVQKGDTFVALPGATVDGHDYVAKAYELGATKAIVEHKVDCEIEVLDIDKRLIEYINEISKKYDLNIKTRVYNALDDTPKIVYIDELLRSIISP